MMLYVPVLRMSEKSTITGRAVVDCTIDQFEEEILAILGLDETCVKVLVDPRETSLQNDTYSLWRAKASARCGYASAFRPMASPRYRNLCFAGVCSDGRNYCTGKAVCTRGTLLPYSSVWRRLTTLVQLVRGFLPTGL